MTVGIALATTAPAASAMTFTVSGFGDPAGATCTGSTCASLRAAVTAADLDVGDVIALGAGPTRSADPARRAARDQPRHDDQR
jgi:hypothetical protein